MGDPTLYTTQMQTKHPSHTHNLNFAVSHYHGLIGARLKARHEHENMIDYGQRKRTPAMRRPGS
jgi:hypothetical protein